MARTSPFPGMDPWVEYPWGGMHNALIGYIQEQLNDQLPPELVARVDERVFIGHREDESDVQVRRPDVYVIERPGAAPSDSGASLTAVINKPVILRFVDEEPVTQGYIEIVDAADAAKVYTAIEVLNPTNKSDPDGHIQYLAKRKQYHLGGVSTVEIDLLREGKQIVSAPFARMPQTLRTPYCVSVRRGWRLESREVEYYAIALRIPLPVINVPLRMTDADAAVDLQKAFEASYRRNRLDGTDYDRQPKPPLSSEDMAWARQQIGQWRMAGSRSANSHSDSPQA